MKDKYKTLIISCWVVLLICFLIKLLGGNFFAIATDNKVLIAFCNSTQGTILYYLTAIVLYNISTYFYFLAILKKKWFKGKDYIIVGVVFVFSILKVIFIKYASIFFIIELIVTIILPIIINKKLWLRSIIAYCLMIGFQVISLITKNIGIKIIHENFLFSLIFSIDYYVMIILYYLYSIKEENKNGNFWFRIFNKRKRRNDNTISEGNETS